MLFVLLLFLLNVFVLRSHILQKARALPTNEARRTELYFHTFIVPAENTVVGCVDKRTRLAVDNCVSLVLQYHSRALNILARKLSCHSIHVRLCFNFTNKQAIMKYKTPLK